MSLNKEKQKVIDKRFWHLRCDQQLAHKEAPEEKDNEIAQLTKFLSVRTAGDERTNMSLVRGNYDEVSSVSFTPWSGKAPLVHLFSGDSSEDSWDNWLPTFKGVTE